MALAWNPKQSFDIEKRKSKMERSKIDKKKKDFSNLLAYKMKKKSQKRKELKLKKKKKRLVEFVVILNVKHKPSLK